jgi:hypothetical protein
MTQWNAPSGDPYGQPPGYGQPGYGQPGYGQPGYGPPGPPNRLEQSDSFGIVGTVLTLLGGILVVVGFTAVDWFTGSGGHASFSGIRQLLDSEGGSASGFSSAYFGWLAWTFLVIVVVAGVLSSVPTPALRIFRIIGIVDGIAAAGLTFLAINFADGTGYTEYLKHARLGFYFAVIGFLVAGIGAGIGPRRV